MGVPEIIPNFISFIIVDNPCDGHGCSHFCLLSSEAVSGYTCACASGGVLNMDLITCNCEYECVYMFVCVFSGL